MTHGSLFRTPWMQPAQIKLSFSLRNSEFGRRRLDPRYPGPHAKPPRWEPDYKKKKKKSDFTWGTMFFLYSSIQGYM